MNNYCLQYNTGSTEIKKNLLIADGGIYLGKYLDPDLAGDKLKLLALAIFEDSAVETGFLAPGDRKCLSLAKYQTIAATGGAVEQVFLGVNRSGFGGEDNYHSACFDLLIGVLVFVGFTAVVSKVNLGI